MKFMMAYETIYDVCCESLSDSCNKRLLRENTKFIICGFVQFISQFIISTLCLDYRLRKLSVTR